MSDGDKDSLPPTRPSLLVQCRDPENQPAWETFVEIYTPLIYGYYRHRGLQDADAADLAQEVMRSVARALQSFEYDPARGRFRSWLHTVTCNKLKTFFQKQQRRPRAESGTQGMEMLDAIPAPEGDDIWERAYQKQLFEWAAAQVKPMVKEQTWEAFWRCAIENEDSQSVAESLGLSVGSVYVAKSRVIGRLRECVCSVDEDGLDGSDHPLSGGQPDAATDRSQEK